MHTGAQGPESGDDEMTDAVTRRHATYASAALKLGIESSTVMQTLRTFRLRLGCAVSLMCSIGHPP